MITQKPTNVTQKDPWQTLTSSYRHFVFGALMILLLILAGFGWAYFFIFGIQNQQIAILALCLAIVFIVSVVSLGYLLYRRFIAPAFKLVNYFQQVCSIQEPVEPSLPVLWQPFALMITRCFRTHRDVLRQLTDGEAFKSVIVENSMLAVISMDREGRIKEFNRAAQQMFGLNTDDVIDRDLADLIIPERFRAAHRAGLARHLHTGQSQVIGANLRLDALHGDGYEFPIELTIFVVPEGDYNYYTAFVIDHTQSKQAEEELARQRDALRQSEKLSAMGALLAGVAHELNNPLAILMGRAALLEDKAKDIAIRADAEKIRVAADRCGRIVKTFLAMARQKTAERKWTSLNEVVAGAIELLGYSLRSAGIKLTQRLNQQLAPVEMDADQIGQVVVNLIINAQQALATVSTPRKLHLETGQQDGKQFFRISDNGPGVPAELKERIFDPFFTTKTDGIGTGIGLSVSRAILREHGGELRLEASETGASFLMALPATQQQYDRAGRSSSNDDNRMYEGIVLIVDDEPEVAEVLAEILASAGYQVHVVASGHEALRWLEQHPCDLLFSDVRMPEMDGISLWRNIKSRYPNLAKHMALVTGDTLSANIAPLLAETGLPYLEKPFLPEEVLSLAARIE